MIESFVLAWLVSQAATSISTYKRNTSLDESTLSNLSSSKDSITVLVLRKTNRTPRNNFGFKWFIPSIIKYKKHSLKFYSFFLCSAISVDEPLIIQQIIDKVIGQNGINTLPVLAVLLFSFDI